MSIETAWLEVIAPAEGRDHVGVRTTSVRMYSHLVPGITNITDRARYYSLHSYLVHYWAKRHGNDDMDGFFRALRRAECLVGFADELHDSDSYAIVGQRTIGAWLKEQGELRGSQRVPVGALAEEYLGGTRGGYGRYYAGPERDLGLVTEIDGVVRLMEPRGKALAEAFAKSADRCGFSELLEQDEVRADKLREVGRELGLGRAAGEERRALRGLLLDESGGADTPGARRRRTILCLLALANAETAGLPDPNWDILRAALHRRRPGGERFLCPRPLVEHMDLWRVYALHEQFSFALEAILSVAVEVVGELEMEAASGNVEETAAQLGALVSPGIAKRRFSDLIDSAKRGVREDGAEDPEDEFDEASLRERIAESLEDERGEALASTIRLLARLSARVRGVGNPYAKFVEEGLFLEKGRLSLIDLAALAETRGADTCREVMISLARTVLATHLRVACGKLTQNRIYTYKVAYQGGRLTKVQGTWPIFSSPRLRKAAQMTADVGFMKLADGNFSITEDGKKALEGSGCL